MSDAPPQLVAIATSRQKMVDAVAKVWEAGHAFTPIDTRLSTELQQAQITRLQPDFIMSDDLELTTNPSLNQTPTTPLAQLLTGDALAIETSGSTGEPKQVIHTHDSLTASAKATSKLLGVTESDTWLSCLPFSHIGGLAVLLRSILLGTEIEVLETINHDSIIESAKRCSLVSMVQRQASQLSEETLGNFRRILLGGGPGGINTDNVIKTYGLTETGSGIYYQGNSLPQGFATVGDTELRINDEGVLEIKGATLFRAYRNIHATSSSQDGWFTTGDLGSIDESGKLTITGRQSLLIRTGGEDVSPEILEARLNEHPQIKAAAVTSRPSKEWGNEVVAVLVLGEDSAEPSLEELAEWTRKTLPNWYTPKHVVVTDELPRLPNSKVDRGRLKSLFARH